MANNLETDEEYDFVDLDKIENKFDEEHNFEEKYNFVDLEQTGDQILSDVQERNVQEKMNNCDKTDNEDGTGSEIKFEKEMKFFSPDDFLSCDQCNHSTPIASNLKRHIRTVHHKIRALCGICDQEFADLKNHREVVHEKVRNFKCEECEYSCYRQYRLKMHIYNRHSNQSVSYMCPKCFVKCSDIESHMQRVHLNPIPDDHNFPCTYCEFTAKSKNTLRGHIRTIHQETLISCRVCAHNVNKWKITVHMRKHLDNKFKCKLCDKTYREKRDLAKHILYVHKNFRYQCTFCEKEVPNILQHMKFMHKNNGKDVDTKEETERFRAIKVCLGENLIYNGEF